LLTGCAWVFAAPVWPQYAFRGNCRFMSGVRQSEVYTFRCGPEKNVVYSVIVPDQHEEVCRP
jgi:hypothetical protein